MWIASKKKKRRIRDLLGLKGSVIGIAGIDFLY